MRHKLLEVGEYTIDIGHESNFTFEHKTGTDRDGNPIYETDYLCIFRVKLDGVWTVYFRHTSVPFRRQYHNRTAWARFLISDLDHAREVFSFEKGIQPL